ncbi:hypothetical protein J6590_068457 [Homalodisca vitripennis]|nr:hypothetical protein J6590_068457 [Homalodisca vitripennis]
MTRCDGTPVSQSSYQLDRMIGHTRAALLRRVYLWSLGYTHHMLSLSPSCIQHRICNRVYLWSLGYTHHMLSLSPSCIDSSKTSLLCKAFNTESVIESTSGRSATPPHGHHMLSLSPSCIDSSKTSLLCKAFNTESVIESTSGRSATPTTCCLSVRPVSILPRHRFCVRPDGSGRARGVIAYHRRHERNYGKLSPGPHTALIVGSCHTHQGLGYRRHGDLHCSMCQ